MLGLALCAAPAMADELSGSRFELHADPWINLHHFLYHAARNTLRGEEILRGRVRIDDADRAVELAGEDARTWQDALRTYAALGDRDILFDADMQRIREALVGGEAAVGAQAADPVFAALAAAMPVYRRHWWPRHEALNRARLAELRALLARYEASLAAVLARAYEAEWPAAPIRVDLTAYGGRHGAYTASPPHHIVMASGPEWYPGLYGLEVLFHEAGHLRAFESNVLAASEAGAVAAGVEEGGVWHAYLFFVPARVAKWFFPDGYEPYPWRFGVFTEGRMSRHVPAIEEGAPGGSLAEVFRIIHQARADASGSSDAGPTHR